MKITANGIKPASNAVCIALGVEFHELAGICRAIAFVSIGCSHAPTRVKP